jgi:hypothetical protein
MVDGWNAPAAGWFSGSDGWSVGGRLGIPLLRGFRSVAEVDYDLAHSALLGIRGTLGYRHPCGCFALTAWGGHRAGRAGVDSWLAVDLAP